MSDNRTTPRDHGPHTLKVWPGTVVGIYGEDVFVELGPRMQGVISRSRFEREPKVGEGYEFTLRGQEEGLWILARREERPLATWEDLELGSVVHARAIRAARGGLEMKIGPLHAFMPRSHAGLPREQGQEVLVGKTLVCEVIEVPPDRQRVVVSRKLVLQRERESERQRRIGSLAPGQVVRGRVTRVEDYGAFVAFGEGMEGLVHVSDIDYERVSDPRDVLRVGQTVEARVLAIKRGGKRIALGLKQMGESPWVRLEQSHYVGQIVEGVVTRLRPAGAFVAIRRGVEGFVPRAQAGLQAGQGLEAVLQAGQRVSVRILELDCERERLSLSLLHGDGVRIDPDEASNRKLLEGGSDSATGGWSLGEVLRGVKRDV
jgi:small subunit ribosomal protein S1